MLLLIETRTDRVCERVTRGGTGDFSLKFRERDVDTGESEMEEPRAQSRRRIVYSSLTYVSSAYQRGQSSTKMQPLVLSCRFTSLPLASCRYASSSRRLPIASRHNVYSLSSSWKRHLRFLVELVS